MTSKKKRLDFDQARKTANEEISVHTNALDRMRQFASELFESRTPSGLYERSPRACIRLMCEGNPPAVVAVTAHWNRRRRLLDTQRIQFELMVLESCDGFKGVSHMKITASMAGVALDGYRGLQTHLSVNRIATTCSQFLADPLSVFARSVNNCCICSHKLEDNESRSRGIGPECIKFVSRFWTKGSRFSIFDRHEV